MKEVYATNNEVEIQMLVGLLESQGILAQVHADGAGGYRSWLHMGQLY